MATDFLQGIQMVQYLFQFAQLKVDEGKVSVSIVLYIDNQRPARTCPHSESDRTDVAYSYSDSESVKQAVCAALSEHLDDDGLHLW